MSNSTFRRLRAFCLGVALAAGWPSMALGADADTDRLAALQQQLDASIAMINALAARVRELEAREGAAPVIAPAPAPGALPATPDSQRIAAVEQKVALIETANATRHGDDTGLPTHGFADVGAGTYNPYATDVKGFYVGNLDFYLTPRLGDRSRALFELNFEAGSDGSVDVDLERAQIGYQFSDQATVWIGRFHTPYGYVNTATHHGAWIMDSLRRPKFLQFEDQGGSLPAHTVGAWLTGAARIGDDRILYDLYVGNGQQIVDGTIDMRNAGNAHGNLIVGGRAGYQFESAALDGLTVGVHALSSRIDDDQLPGDITRVQAWGAYAVLDNDRWEHMAELYIFNNEDLSGGAGYHRSEAGFAQLGYRTSWGVSYIRYERAAFDQSDQFFLQQRAGNSYFRGALGVRIDIDFKSALKFELANTHDTDRVVDQYSEALAQYAIRF